LELGVALRPCGIYGTKSGGPRPFGPLGGSVEDFDHRRFRDLPADHVEQVGVEGLTTCRRTSLQSSPLLLGNIPNL
jgi:hypothetical protein